jgi:hypothetical protein
MGKNWSVTNENFGSKVINTTRDMDILILGIHSDSWENVAYQFLNRCLTLILECWD